MCGQREVSGPLQLRLPACNVIYLCRPPRLDRRLGQQVDDLRVGAETKRFVVFSGRLQRHPLTIIGSSRNAV